jgi:hypothetical protein
MVIDISLATANTTPLQLPQGEFDSANFIQFSFAGLAAADAFTFQLILADHTLADTGSEKDATIIRAITFPVTVPAGARRTDGDGAGGYYFCTDVIVDIRGIPSSADQHQWHLVCTDVGGSTVRLLRYRGIQDGS